MKRVSGSMKNKEIRREYQIAAARACFPFRAKQTSGVEIDTAIIWRLGFPDIHSMVFTFRATEEQ